MSAPVMPVHPDTVHQDLADLIGILSRWSDSIGKQGIPGVDIPSPDGEVRYEQFLRQFTGELFYVAGRAQNLAVILSER